MLTDTILHGDALATLRGLPAESVQCVVTSPPYFGLRDYGTAAWVGGDATCDHKPAERLRSDRPMGMLQANKVTRELSAGAVATVSAGTKPYGAACGKCGATRQDAQIGLEETPEAYVAKLVEVFRECKRVLRRDGVLWLNLGDSYGSDEIGRHDSVQGRMIDGKRVTSKATKRQLRPKTSHKQLLGMPWRVAFALQADGWVLRSDVIWHKPNCMPESVRDRPTKSHEYLFLFAKSERYYYDAEAIREDNITASNLRNKQAETYGAQAYLTPLGAGPREWNNPSGRNKRTVWTVATQPFSQAHFATFPPALIEPCILAGSSPQACEVCGAPWERVTERVTSWREGVVNRQQSYVIGSGNPRIRASSGGMSSSTYRDTGWRPTCRCDNTGSGRCVILDPFFGAGTVGLVAAQHGRQYLGIELNASYIEMAERRIADARKPKAKIIKLRPLPDGIEQPSLWAI